MTEHYKAYSYYRYNSLSQTNYMAFYSDGSEAGAPDLPEGVLVCSTLDPLGYFDSDCQCLAVAGTRGHPQPF
ncbi:hypothetical protein P4S72_23490 [Vibrio sp. PP-XX7]